MFNVVRPRRIHSLPNPYLLQVRRPKSAKFQFLPSIVEAFPSLLYHQSKGVFLKPLQQPAYSHLSYLWLAKPALWASPFLTSISLFGFAFLTFLNCPLSAFFQG